VAQLEQGQIQWAGCQSRPSTAFYSIPGATGGIAGACLTLSVCEDPFDAMAEMSKSFDPNHDTCGGEAQG